VRCFWGWAVEVAGMDGEVVGLEWRFDFGAAGVGVCDFVAVAVAWLFMYWWWVVPFW
jgi:hypothetical protein